MAQAYTERNSGQACLRVAEGLSIVFDFATGQVGWAGFGGFRLLFDAQMCFYDLY
jgi:hypothetical protein